MEAYLAEVWRWTPRDYDGMSLSEVMGYYRRAVEQQEAKAAAYRKAGR